MNKATIADIDLNGKTALVRVDFNVPVKGGVITDDTRIKATLPTLKYLLEHNAKVVLMSHLGRPDGQKVPEMSLKPVAERLSALLGKPVIFAPDCIGEEVQQIVSRAKPGEVVLLENLRYYPEEEKNDPEFAKKLASLGEIYVNDAFGTAHRAHASTAGVAAYLPAVAGFLMEKELNFLGKLLENPEKPFITILGGAKVKDKIGVIKNLSHKVDGFLIGGGMAFTFLKVQGYEIGKSILDEKIQLAEETLDDCQAKGLGFELPMDVVVAPEIKEGVPTRVVGKNLIPADMIGVDIGPETCRAFADIIAKAKTIFWNGPMGVFEIPEFARGTEAVAKAVAANPGLTCAGGGDSVAAIDKLGLEDKFTHISTGGGASLEFMEGKTLPGVAALLDKEKVAR